MSVTEQPPASGVKLALLGMCLSNITNKLRDDNIICFDTTSGIRHIFAEHLLDTSADEHSDSEKQTERIFDYLQKKLVALNASIENSVLRTWIYAPHVDADYPGIVKARKELFDRINLKKETLYRQYRYSGRDRWSFFARFNGCLCGNRNTRKEYSLHPCAGILMPYA